MPPIKILPQQLADKIAAGEVVERPASVVKELMENAIDAGATHIQAAVSKRPSDQIEISDNGCGMSLEEAQLAIQRHATSKLAGEGDLFNIRTLGFRGEALPSIAAVSKMKIWTKAQEATLEGAAVQVHGGKVVEASPAASPKGTRVLVQELFYNTPARLKFLKSDGVELGHIEDIFIRLALSNFDCAFDYSVDGVSKISSPVGKDPLQRLQSCLGDDFVANGIAVEERHPELTLKGWLVSPNQTASTANDIHFYLNGRFLRDRMLQHALIAGFGDFLMKGRYPKAVLYLEIDPKEVDVNVHPAKREVRFVKPQGIHEFVSKAIKKALQKKTENFPDRASEPVSKRHPSIWGFHPQIGGSTLAPPVFVAPTMYGVAPGRFSQPARLRDPENFPVFFFKELKVIGSFNDTYILCEASGGKLILIDQHAAHERIGFEKLKKNLGNKNVAQRLLVPITWEATTKQTALMNSHLEDLQKTGIEIEPFGQNTFVIKAVPALIREAKTKELLEKIAEELEEIGTAQTVGNAIDHVLKTISCHTMVRAQDKLSFEEMRHLLIEMDEYHATHCPHGRPTSVELSLSEIEKWFKRT